MQKKEQKMSPQGKKKKLNVRVPVCVGLKEGCQLTYSKPLNMFFGLDFGDSGARLLSSE